MADPDVPDPLPQGAASTDHKVLQVGWGLLLGLFLELLLLWFWQPDMARALTGGVLAGALLGREAGIPAGLTLGAPPLVMWQVSATRDLATGAIAYGLLMTSMDRAGRLGEWMRRILQERTEEAAGRQGFIRRWGRPGLFVFMLVPFMVNGPLVVGLGGRLCGMKTRDMLLPAAGATFVAAAIWVLFTGAMLRLLAQVETGLEVAITGIFLGGMLAAVGWQVFKAVRRSRRESMDS